MGNRELEGQKVPTP